MKIKTLMALFIFSLFTITIFVSVPVPATVATSSTTPSAGDTFIYKITQWSVPSDLSIFDYSNSLNGITTNVNLAGTTIGFKILSVSTNSYSYGLYIQASNGPIQLTVPSNVINSAVSNVTSSTNVTDLLNNAGAGSINLTDILTPFLTGTGNLVLNLPAGAAFPIINSASSTYNYTNGIGLWLKAGDWSAVKTAISNTPGLSYTETGNTITIMKAITDTHSTGNVSLTYTETADAIFTQLQYKLDVKDKNGVTQPITITLSYNNTENNPLPSTLSTGNILKYVVGTSSLDITTNLDSNTQNAIDLAFSTNLDNLSTIFGGAQSLAQAISYLKNQTNSEVGKPVAQFTITGVNGAFYNASVLLGGSSSSSNYMFNGFTGTAECVSTDCSTAYGFAPVITPDFAMWNGVSTDVNTLGNILVRLFSASTASTNLQANYTSLGLTSGPNLVFSAGYSNQTGYKLYGASGHLDFTYNSTTASQPAPFTAYLTLTSDINGSIAVSNEGYTLAFGMKASAGISFDVRISLGSNAQSIPLKGSAQLTYAFVVKLSSQSVGVPSNIINLANTAGQQIGSSVTPISPTPGFEFIAVIASLATVPIIVRKIKHKNK